MEDRIQELEIRYTLQQDLLQQLSDVVAQQGAAIARLRAELDEIKNPRATDALPFDPDEKPPHY